VGKNVEDLLGEMRNNPANVWFADACKVADHYFGNLAAKARATTCGRCRGLVIRGSTFKGKAGKRNPTK
jgi:hypothetical protein